MCSHAKYEKLFHFTIEKHPSFQNNVIVVKIVHYCLDCPQTIPPFHGKHGRIIRGHVSPPLEGVIITLSSEQIGPITIATDKDGIYRYLLC